MKQELETEFASEEKRARDLGKVLDSIWAMPPARAASLRPQPPTAFSRSGIAIANDGDLPRCYNCLGPAAEEDGLCRDCFDEINGQFGVGA